MVRSSVGSRHSVGVVAERIGVTSATLRSWNRRYGIGPAGHAPGQNLLYSEADVAAVEQMQRLIVAGASAADAAGVAITDVLPAQRDSAQLLAAAFALDNVAMERVIERHLCRHGVVDTWDNLIQSAFAAISEQQAATGDCVEIEHAFSRVVSRSLQRFPAVAPRGPYVPLVLACTEYETHTLSLEAMCAGLAEHRRPALMLGASVPVDALLDALARQSQRAAVMLWSQTPDTADRTALEAAQSAACYVIVGGPGWRCMAVPRATLRVTSLHAALEAVLAGI